MRMRWGPALRLLTDVARVPIGGGIRQQGAAEGAWKSRESMDMGSRGPCRSFLGYLMMRALWAATATVVLLAAGPARVEALGAEGSAVVGEVGRAEAGTSAAIFSSLPQAGSYKCTVDWQAFCVVDLQDGERRHVVRIGEGVGYSDTEESGCSEAETKATKGAAGACTEHAGEPELEPCSCVPIGPSGRARGSVGTASTESAVSFFDPKPLHHALAAAPVAASVTLQEQNMCAPCDLLAEKYGIAYAKAEASREALEEVVKAMGDFERDRNSASFAAGAVLFLKPIQMVLGVVTPTGRACSEVARKWAGTLVSGIVGLPDYGEDQSVGRTALGAAIAYAGFGPVWDYFDAIQIGAQTTADTIVLDQIERGLGRTRAKLTAHARRFRDELARLEVDLRRGGCDVPSREWMRPFLGGSR